MALSCISGKSTKCQVVDADDTNRELGDLFTHLAAFYKPHCMNEKSPQSRKVVSKNGRITSEAQHEGVSTLDRKKLSILTIAEFEEKAGRSETASQKVTVPGIFYHKRELSCS